MDKILTLKPLTQKVDRSPRRLQRRENPNAKHSAIMSDASLSLGESRPAVKSYSEKLRDPRWQRRRLEVLNHADFRCQICGSKIKTLHVHHSYYDDREPWEYPIGSMIAACEDCHETHHFKGGELAHKIEDLIGQIFSLERIASDKVHCALRRRIRVIQLRMGNARDEDIPALHAQAMRLQSQAVMRRHILERRVTHA